MSKHSTTCKYFIDINSGRSYCFLKSITIHDVIRVTDCVNCSQFNDSDISQYLQVQIDKRGSWLRNLEPSL